MAATGTNEIYFQKATLRDTAVTVRPKPNPTPTPLLRLEVRDLSADGARSFLSLLNCDSVLQEAVDSVLSLLYTSKSKIPPTRSVTLVLRSMEGVAYTTGKEIDGDHKEIHFSTDYIAGCSEERRAEEMLGVLRHEMVHCWQWAANGTCPSGLIEGIADWVRLKSNMVPPHWKQEGGGDWDAGYQHTAYFLEYLETRFGQGTVVAINERLCDRDYVEKGFWIHCCGCEVQELWDDYGRSLTDAQKGSDTNVTSPMESTV
ncbi:BSP-domain-containing protein [Trichodelitschia bisporula]|uniref:BSP-domain-containing protein n=1 Tax=Trichodelitschia bisporula TaxID=703511 RepID=A0A6G1I1M3_9PEZI|nr:BSP-domain-containing protein [Trichodelitschia bisporula]